MTSPRLEEPKIVVVEDAASLESVSQSNGVQRELWIVQPCLHDMA